MWASILWLLFSCSKDYTSLQQHCGARKILRIGKGTLPAKIAGIYTGRHPHSTQLAGGNEEIQRLCGEHGVARGKEKYTVARSESTTVIGVILYYKNQAASQTPPITAGPSQGTDNQREKSQTD